MKYTVEIVEYPYFEKCEEVEERIYNSLKEKLLDVIERNIDKFIRVSSCKSKCGITRFLATVEIVDLKEEVWQSD